MKLRIPPPLIALISGLLIDISAILAFRRAKTTVTPLAPEKASTLVISGLYRVTRNPMYLGLLLILIGVALLLGSPLNAAIIIAFMAYITGFQIKPEEEKLTEIFGAQYLSYMQDVRRWI